MGDAGIRHVPQRLMQDDRLGRRMLKLARKPDRLRADRADAAGASTELAPELRAEPHSGGLSVGASHTDYRRGLACVIACRDVREPSARDGIADRR